MTDSSRPTVTPGAVKSTALRMDTITDVAAMVCLTIGMIAGQLDVQLWLGAICAIAGLMKFATVRGKGGAVLALLGALGWATGRVVG